MKVTKNQIKKLEQAWKYCNVSNEPFKAIALYRQLQVEFFNTNEEKYIDVLIEETKAWKICVIFNYLTEDEGRETFNAIIKLCEDTLLKSKTDFKPHQLFEIGHLQISLAKKYKEGIKKLEYFKKTEGLDNARILEVNGFIGYAKFMLGNKKSGINILKKTVIGFENLDINNSKYQKISVDLIKYTGALLKLASIIGNKTEAKEYATKALNIAKTKGLEARKMQAENFLKSINDKISK